VTRRELLFSAFTFMLVGAFAFGGVGCGYRLAHAEPDPLGPFTVQAGSLTAPASEARIATLSGARSMLARHGQLASRGGSTGRPPATIVIDVLRVQERAAAVSTTDDGATPMARSVQLTITGRARMRIDAATVRDTGDVQVDELVSPGTDVASFELARDEAVRVASQRLGQALVRRLLLLP